MIDSYHRIINYLRISVTDRCNLRCIYCQPSKGFQFFPRAEILSFEEIIRLVHVAVKIGISKIRLTGGDPLVRRDIVKLIKDISLVEGVTDLALTTNGVRLEQMAQELYEAGQRRINISLDSLNPQKFQLITGQGSLAQVWRGIEKAVSVGFSPIKINVVVMKGINDDELVDLAKLSLIYPFHIRFIEFMPLGNDQLWKEKKYLSCLKVKRIIYNYLPLYPTSVTGPHHSLNNGPAQMFEFKGAPGKIGFISPLSNHFCASCNRIRLTADGKIRHCLFSDQETDLKPALRESTDNELLEALMRAAIKNKPVGHYGLPAKETTSSTPHRSMGSIGG